jgi:ArsR family transcriptional regulator
MMLEVSKYARPAALPQDDSQPSGAALASHERFHHHRHMDESTVIRSLSALAQPVRLQVFRALVVTGRAGLTPGAMAEALGIPPNTLSFHLKELTGAGLVSHRRVGRFVVYRAEYEHMSALLGYLTDNCCQGVACAVEPPSVTCDC